MAKATRQTAEAIAAKITRPISHEVLRDRCDLETDGELDAFALDLLTDMVAKRINGLLSPA